MRKLLPTLTESCTSTYATCVVRIDPSLAIVVCLEDISLRTSQLRVSSRYNRCFMHVCCSNIEIRTCSLILALYIIAFVCLFCGCRSQPGVRSLLTLTSSQSNNELFGSDHRPVMAQFQLLLRQNYSLPSPLRAHVKCAVPSFCAEVGGAYVDSKHCVSYDTSGCLSFGPIKKNIMLFVI